VLIGITHNPQGQPIIREPRVLKVGIGLPRGRCVSIYIHQGKWHIRYGVWEKTGGKDKLVMKTFAKCETRKQAEDYHAANYEKAAVADRPQKLPFFTFSRRTITEVDGKTVECFEPDFQAIDQHGECPREIDIVIMNDQPFIGEYQMWTATELKCHGDGLLAERVLSMGNDSLPGWSNAKAEGRRHFHIEPCWTNGCPFAQETSKNGKTYPAACKPSVTLTFQLAKNLRIGATSYFHTTSIRSSYQIFSALETIRMAANRVGASLVGLPLKMILSPFRTNHNGQPATQYGVSLELRAEDMAVLRNRLAESVWEPKKIASAPVIQEVEDIPVLTASTVAGEFYPETVDDEEGEPETAAATQAARATESKTKDLADKLNAKVKEPLPGAEEPTVTKPEFGKPYAELKKWQKEILAIGDNLGQERTMAVLSSAGIMSINDLTDENSTAVLAALRSAMAEMPQKDMF
jgi:Recombination directionality factor-like